MMFLICITLLSLYKTQAVPLILNSDDGVIKIENNEEPDDSETLLKEINDLEKQKQELYILINKAINESIDLLKNSNDTDSIQGVSYIEDLKAQIEEFNNADDISDFNTFDGNVTEDVENEAFLGNGTIDTRRKYKNFKKALRTAMKKEKKKIKYGHAPVKVLNIKPPQESGEVAVQKKFDSAEGYLEAAQQELDRLLNKGLEGEKLKQRIIRREKIRAQLDDWIKMKELERAKIKAYKDSKKSKRGKQELCPRSGHQSKGKQKGLQPCCRKCCKRSYLGCLK